VRSSPEKESVVKMSGTLKLKAAVFFRFTDDRNKVEWMGVEIVARAIPSEHETLE
jgi:hypothetical protein